jgi:hypothetical protein
VFFVTHQFDLADSFHRRAVPARTPPARQPPRLPVHSRRPAADQLRQRPVRAHRRPAAWA